jgi:Bax protein
MEKKMIRNKYATQRLRRNKLKKKKKQFEITVIHVFTACILAVSFFVLTSEAKAIDKPTIITKTKPLFVYSLNSCIEHLYKDMPIHKQVPNELIVAQAVVETGWGDSRFANEANNLFGIRTFDRDDNYMLPKTLTNWPGWGVKVFASKCDSVEYYVRIINEVWAYEAFRSLRQRHLSDGVIPDGMELAMTLDSYATDPNYIPLVRSVIKNNIRGVYDL